MGDIQYKIHPVPQANTVQLMRHAIHKKKWDQKV